MNKEYECDTIRKKVMNTVLGKGLPFYEWTMSYKGWTYPMFTTQTARKTLSEQPFSYSVSVEEEKDIINICKEIFPEHIWKGTEKEQKNYAKLCFANTETQKINKLYCEASDLYENISCMNRNIFLALGTANASMSLCTYAEEKNKKSSIYSINAIAVSVDYKKAGFNNKNGKNKVIDILKTEHFGKTMPYPFCIVEEDQLVLIFAFENPVYIYRHMNGINFFEWMSKIFAERISYLGGIPMKVNAFVNLPHSAVAKSRDKKVRCETKWNVYGAKTDASTLRSFLMSMEELKEKYPWYKTKKEKNKRKREWDPHFLHNTKNMLEDLIKIRDYYNNNGIFWYNNKMLFIYCVYAMNLLHDEESVLKMACAFSDGFCERIDEWKIKSTIRCAAAKQYKFRNETVLNNLSISKQTAAHLGLKICEAKNNRKNYLKRWRAKKSEENKHKKETKKDTIYSIIEKLRKKGLKNLSILSTLIKNGFEMSIKTLERYIKEMISAGTIKPRIKPA